MKNRKHLFIPLFVFLGACLVSLVWAIIDFTAVDRTLSYSSQTLQFDYDGASEGVDPNGDPFNAASFLTDDVIYSGLQKSGVQDKYEIEQVRKYFSVDNIVPQNIVKEINEYESLVDSSNGREITADDYHPVRYRFSLYQDFDNKLSSKSLNEILNNIVDSYVEKFYEVYKKTYNPSVIDELFDMDNLDYIYQTMAYSNKINILANYAKTIFEEHDDFTVVDKTFEDIVIKADKLVSSDVNYGIKRINNLILLKALSKNLDRLKDYYEYKVETLQYDKTKNTSDLNAVTEQLNAYKKDATIYVGSGENIVKVDSNSDATYNKLAARQSELSRNIASINTEIKDYQDILEDINNASGTDAEYTLVNNYLAKLDTDYKTLEQDFGAMLTAYNEKYILNGSVSKTEVKYASGSIFSSAFILRCVKIGAPIILITLFGICCFYLIRTIGREKEIK